MNSAETLKPTESAPLLPEAKQHFTPSLNRQQIDRIFAERFEELEKIREWVSLKFYYAVKEKIEAEQKVFLSLLNLETKKQDILSGYSFALDTHFFEQKFLNA